MKPSCWPAAPLHSVRQKWALQALRWCRKAKQEPLCTGIILKSPLLPGTRAAKALGAPPWTSLWYWPRAAQLIHSLLHSPSQEGLSSPGAAEMGSCSCPWLCPTESQHPLSASTQSPHGTAQCQQKFPAAQAKTQIIIQILYTYLHDPLKAPPRWGNHWILVSELSPWRPQSLKVSRGWIM